MLLRRKLATVYSQAPLIILPLTNRLTTRLLQLARAAVLPPYQQHCSTLPAAWR